MMARFQGEAAAPSGEPPQTDRRASSISIEAVLADGSDAGIEPASHENHALYKITGGGGRFARAGLITTNFLLWPATGQFEERQVAVVFVP
jgi:hypothetical protein